MKPTADLTEVAMVLRETVTGWLDQGAGPSIHAPQAAQSRMSGANRQSQGAQTHLSIPATAVMAW